MTQANPTTAIPSERPSPSRPANLRLPTPGCYADPHRSGLSASDVFDGMTEHLFYTLGKLAPTASRRSCDSARLTLSSDMGTRNGDHLSWTHNWAAPTISSISATMAARRPGCLIMG